MVNLEHVPPPDVAYLEDARFRTFIPHGFSGRQSRQPRRSSFGYGRGRPSYSRGFGSLDRYRDDFSERRYSRYGSRDDEHFPDRRYGSRYGSGDDERFPDRRYGSRYLSRDDGDFSGFSNRRRKSYEYDDFS